MAAVQTCTVPQPSRMNSAASCQLAMPPMPDMGRAPAGSDCTCCTMLSAIGLTAGPQYPPWELLPSTLGLGWSVFKVDAGDGVDGVDGGERIGPATLGGARRHADVGDVGGELDDHRGARLFLHPAGDLLAVLGDLSHGGAHSPLAHAVRAAEVQFQSIGAGVFCTLHDVVPDVSRLLSTMSEAMTTCFGIAALDLGDFLQVDFDGAVGDELDIIEAHHAPAFPVDGGVARADIGDGLADGLPHRAAPAGIEGAHDLLAAVGGRRGGQPEGIEALNAAEGGFKRGA